MPFIVVIHASDAPTARAIRDRYLDGDAGRTVAVYELPRATTVVCERPLACPAGSGWTRNARGAVVHACGRRKRGWRASLNRTLFDLFGVNLLKPKHTPDLFRNPEGWGP